MLLRKVDRCNNLIKTKQKLINYKNPILKGDEKIMDLLLKGGANINALDKDNWTALHRAARNGNA